MQVISWSDFLSSSSPLFEQASALCIGSFDGPHRGHYEIFKKVLSYSRENNTRAGIITFSKTITSIKKQNDYMGDISPLTARLGIFAELGFDFCILIDFSENFAHLEGEDFFKLLKEKLNLVYICEGQDFKCGYKGAFKKDEIFAWGRENSVQTEFIPLVMDEGERISSSKIRKMLKEHEEKKARLLLTALP